MRCFCAGVRACPEAEQRSEVRRKFANRNEKYAGGRLYSSLVRKIGVCEVSTVETR